MQIYKITNLINNKIYIGKSKSDNKNYYGSGILIKKAIKKYNKINFKKEILEDNILNEEILNEREKDWIKYHNSKIPNGYNLTDGGDGILNPSRQIRDKISKSRKGKCIGKDHCFFGKKRPYSVRIKISKSLKGNIIPQITRDKLSNNLIGKSFEERFGEKEANRIKKIISTKLKGNKNGRFCKGRIVSKETREKLSKINKGMKMPQEWIDKMSKDRKGRKYIHKGIKNKIIKPKEIDRYLKEGWILGKYVDQWGEKNPMFNRKGKDCPNYIHIPLEIKNKIIDLYKNKNYTIFKLSTIFEYGRTKIKNLLIEEGIIDIMQKEINYSIVLEDKKIEK